jgi:hypothetical protein
MLDSLARYGARATVEALFAGRKYHQTTDFLQQDRVDTVHPVD